MKIFFIFIFLSITVADNVFFAQTRPVASNVQREITGTVWELNENDSTETVLPYVSIRLLNARDSSFVKGMMTDQNGQFLFSNTNPDNYLLAASFLGYTTSYTPIPADLFSGNKKTIDLGKIELKMSSFMLAEAVIEGRLPEMVVKEDTVEYNSAAFKMQEGAIVEDLLKRLPGVEVEAEGTITAAGKQVRRVMVNGKEFFGNDAKMATQNLTVDMIDKVQVVEKKTDEAILTGVEDGETETIINLVTKKNASKGWFGNVTAGGGALVDNKNGEVPRYNVQNTLNKFSEDSQTSFIVNANNINNRESGRGGITNSNTVGINTSTLVNPKLKVGGNVRYNYTDALSTRNSFRTNLLIDSVSYRTSASENQNYSHGFNFDSKLEYKPDSLYTIVFAPQVRINQSDSFNDSSQETLAGDIDSTRVNRSQATTGSKSNQMQLSGELTVTRTFSQKKGRQISLRVNGSLNHDLTNGSNLSDNEFFLQPSRNKKLNQESQTSNNTNSYGFRAGYIEPLSKTINLQVFYDFRKNNTLNIRETYDYNPEENTYSVLNADYSKSLENNFVTQIIGISLSGSSTKYNYNIGMNISPSFTQSTSFIKNGQSDGCDSILNQIAGRKVVNYSPQINYTYRFNRENNIRFTYRGNTRQPNVTQLDPTPNVTNPLNIRLGNPDLLPSYDNSTSLRFNSNQREKQRALTVSVDYGFTLNEIINFTTYEAETGIQETKPINENGSWNGSGSILFSSPIGKSKRFKFSIDSRISYNNRVGYTTVQKQSERNISGTLGLREEVSFSYTKAWFYGQLRANMGYSNTENSLEGKANQRKTDYRLSFNTQLTLPWNIGINSDINYTANRGLAAGYNKNEVLWNIGLNKQFLKGNRGSVRIQWTDVLRQRISISRNITANYIEDSETNMLTSYVMVSFAYRFNNLKGNNRNQSRSEFQDRPQRDDFQGRPDDWQNGGGQRDEGRQRGGGRP